MALASINTNHLLTEYTPITGARPQLSSSFRHNSLVIAPSLHRSRISIVPSDRPWTIVVPMASSGASNRRKEGDDGKEKDDVDQALHMDGQIPSTSDAFIKQVSSRPYDMRRKLEQSLDTSSYDVLETNPWRGKSKPVYVLAQEENRIITMATRRVRSEVENELSMLFPKQGNRKNATGLIRSSSSHAKNRTVSENRFSMIVEDIREGVLVFEDEEEATKYCSILDEQGKACRGVAELDASDVFALCNSMKAFAVLFRRGTTPPLPERLQLYLKARKRSLED